MCDSSLTFVLVNVFSGILDNPLFFGILLTTAALQALIVEFGSVAFRTVHLKAFYWGVSLAFGAVSLIVQQIINLVFNFFVRDDKQDNAEDTGETKNTENGELLERSNAKPKTHT